MPVHSIPNKFWTRLWGTGLVFCLRRTIHPGISQIGLYTQGEIGKEYFRGVPVCNRLRKTMSLIHLGSRNVLMYPRNWAGHYWGLAAPKLDGLAAYALCLTQPYLNLGATFSVSNRTELITRSYGIRPP